MTVGSMIPKDGLEQSEFEGKQAKARCIKK
jgi:hypothetical protein